MVTAVTAITLQCDMVMAVQLQCDIITAVQLQCDIITVVQLHRDIVMTNVSDIQGRIRTTLVLKPGEGENSWSATVNVLRNKPSNYHHRR
ncbi:hypothetical protein Lal_00026966 [Lupinus albus]|nr:hypothetical protein Lal_00026966 [Lupinus albus]